MITSLDGTNFRHVNIIRRKIRVRERWTGHQLMSQCYEGKERERTGPFSGLMYANDTPFGCYGIPIVGSLIMGDIDAS